MAVSSAGGAAGDSDAQAQLAARAGSLFRSHRVVTTEVLLALLKIVLCWRFSEFLDIVDP